MYALTGLLCGLLGWAHRAGRRRILRSRIAQLQLLLAQPNLDKHPEAWPRAVYAARLALLRLELARLEQQR